MDSYDDALMTDHAYYIAGMVIVAHVLGKIPVSAQIEIKREDSLAWLFTPGAMSFVDERVVSAPTFAYDRASQSYHRRSDEEIQQYAERDIDAKSAAVFMAGRVTLDTYHGRGWPALDINADYGRQRAFDLAEKYHAAPFDQLVYVQAAYARALRILGTQANRRGVQAIVSALRDGQRLTAGDIDILLARSRVRRKRR